MSKLCNRRCNLQLLTGIRMFASITVWLGSMSSICKADSNSLDFVVNRLFKTSNIDTVYCRTEFQFELP